MSSLCHPRLCHIIFEFVRQNDADELVTNGKFPDSTDWTIKATRDNSSTVLSNALKVGSSGSDCEIFVDQVSVKKAAEADGGPQLPEDFALHLAAGTKLRLDFAGTNRIGSCRIDGHVTSGYIDATHPSGLVVGTGCLYVEPKGAMILIR